MQYRRLGRTDLKASILGVGGGYVMFLEEEEGTHLYERAFEYGVNYFDGRYGSTSRMLRPFIKDKREECIVVSKTRDETRDGALQRVDEDLEELGTDYIDIYFLRTYNHDMLEAHLAPGGSLEGLMEARDQGKIHFIGLAGHSDMSALAAGVETDLIDVVIFPLNVVRRDAYEALIPAAQEHDVGLVVMKPVNAGLIPAEIALPWLANQPIHTMVPGMSSLEHLEEDVAALDRPTMTLSPAEEARAERIREQLDNRTCRVCDQVCQAVCEKGLAIDHLLYHDVFYNEYKALGLEGLLAAPLSDWVKGNIQDVFEERLATLQSCTRCGKCEEVCPHHLPITEMFDEMIEDHQILIEALQENDWIETYGDAQRPY